MRSVCEISGENRDRPKAYGDWVHRHYIISNRSTEFFIQFDRENFSQDNLPPFSPLCAELKGSLSTAEYSRISGIVNSDYR